MKEKVDIDSIVDDLHAMILDGSLAPGDKLPPFRKLAERYGVTLPTAQRAVARVQELGLIDVRQGSGARVLPVLEVGQLGILPIWVDAIRRDPEQASSLLADFLELRRALIGEILVVFPGLDTAGREAILGTVSELASIVPRTDEDYQLATALDLKIVTALLAAKSNVAYILLFNTFRTLLQEIPELQRAMYCAPAQNALAYRAVFSLRESARSIDEVLRTVESTVRAIDEMTVVRFKEQLESV